MTGIENREQYESVMARIEELLPLVTEDTPITDMNCVELATLSKLAADYEDIEFPIAAPSPTEAIKRSCQMGLPGRKD